MGILHKKFNRYCRLFTETEWFSSKWYGFSGRKFTSDQTRTVINTELMNGWKMLLVNICSFRGLFVASRLLVHRFEIWERASCRRPKSLSYNNNILNRLSTKLSNYKYICIEMSFDVNVCKDWTQQNGSFTRSFPFILSLSLTLSYSWLSLMIVVRESVSVVDILCWLIPFFLDCSLSLSLSQSVEFFLISLGYFDSIQNADWSWNSMTARCLRLSNFCDEAIVVHIYLDIIFLNSETPETQTTREGERERAGRNAWAY